MNKIYHDPCDPQYDKVENFYKVDNCDICGMVHTKPKRNRDFSIFLLRPELISDIETQLNIVTVARRKENIQDNNIERIEQIHYQFNRWIDKYVDLAKARMQASVKNPFRMAATNRPSEDEITITLSMGEWWNERVLPELNSAIHDFVINGVLYEYLNLYFTPSDALTQSKKEDMELGYEIIKKHICAYKPQFIHKTLKPF